jgi:hypothetical protein
MKESVGSNLRHHSWIHGARLKGNSNMAQPVTQSSQDPRAVAILAKNIYREFRAGGFNERDVMALAGELLSLVTSDVKSRQHETAP